MKELKARLLRARDGEPWEEPAAEPEEVAEMPPDLTILQDLVAGEPFDEEVARMLSDEHQVPLEDVRRTWRA